MEYRTIGKLILMAFLISHVFNGHGFSEDKHANKEAEKIAEKVRRRAESSEKSEGNQDRVKDEVTVRSG